MRKTPPNDEAPGARTTPATDPPAKVPPADEPQAAAPEEAADDSTAPSLVWPPADDELNDWEVLNIQSTGNTVIEPMKFTPPAAKTDAPAPAATSGERRAFTPPAAPAPYVPPAPLDDPAGETSLLPRPSSDVNLPETELIEPLTEVHPWPAGAAGHDVHDGGDERTILIPRPTFGPVRPEPVAARPEPPRPEPHADDSGAHAATRILVSPAFAASMGHAPTVPVSGLHLAAKPGQPRSPMEETLPSGITRELPIPAHEPDRDRSDETALVRSHGHGDTHPVPAAGQPRAPIGPAAASSPFSRVASRGPQPVVPDAPAPVVPPPPLAFGPRAVPSPSPVAPPPAVSASAATQDIPIPTRPAPTSTRRKVLSVGIGLVVILLLALAAYQLASMRSTLAGAPSTATLSVDSLPAGASVAIDGAPRGRTPVRLELSEGNYSLEVTLDGATKRIPLTLAAGTVTAHTLEFAAPAPAAPAADSAIEVRSDPPGGRVVVDGVARGTTPIVVTGLTAGRHEVQVSGPFRTVTRTVTLAPKQQQRLVVTPARTEAAAGPEAAERDRGDRSERARGSQETGYIAIESPIVLRVVRNGDFVGTSEDRRLALPVGPQVIGLENESVGFRDVRTVEIVGGKTTPVPVSLPNGSLSINARPWAEVFVDGNRVGETPVSQLSLPIGIHEIVFRHPDHGERRVSVVVKIGATGRAFTDFTK